MAFLARSRLPVGSWPTHLSSRGALSHWTCGLPSRPRHLRKVSTSSTSLLVEVRLPIHLSPRRSDRLRIDYHTCNTGLLPDSWTTSSWASVGHLLSSAKFHCAISGLWPHMRKLVFLTTSELASTLCCSPNSDIIIHCGINTRSTVR